MSTTFSSPSSPLDRPLPPHLPVRLCAMVAWPTSPPSPPGDAVDVACIVGRAISAGRAVVERRGDPLTATALRDAAHPLLALAASGDPTARTVASHLRRHRATAAIMASASVIRPVDEVTA